MEMTALHERTSAVTEPRDPEAAPDDTGTPERPHEPDTGPWHPVPTDPQPQEPLVEPVETPDAEPTVVAEPDEAEPQEPVVEPVETADAEPDEAPVSTSSTSDSVEPDEAQPQEPLVESVETADAEPTVVVEPDEAPASASSTSESEPPGESVPEEAGEERAGRHEGPSDEDAHSPFAAPEQSETERLVIPDEPVAAAPTEAIFRPPTPTSAPSPEPTRVEPISDEEQRLAAERAARREARTAALAAPAPQPLVAPEPVVIHKRTNDKFWGSLSLALLRIVVAGIFAIRGLNILTDIPAAQAQFATTVLADYPPGPQVMAIVTGVASLLIALALLLGLLTRLAGLGVALIAGGALALVYWGPTWSPFVNGQPGFIGEYQLLLAVVGLLLLLIGGGGWSLDRSFRAGRERNKREAAVAD
jgi:uncharacterized membrane protein YphA (DoxX/SURF4 family)